MTGESYREHLRAPDDPRLQPLRGADAVSYVTRLREIQRIDRVLSEWETVFATTEFEGITEHGELVPGLFPVVAEGAPVEDAVRAADALLGMLDEPARAALVHDVDSRVWRAWMNPEIYLNRFGLRLEERPAAEVEGALALMRASLSERGFEKVRAVMRINGVLGELVGAPAILGELSYNLNLFGTPSLTEPWGWQLYGHHLALNCMFVGGQQVLSPVFVGSEPDALDKGEEPIFGGEEQIALELMRSLDPAQRARAVLWERKRDPAMPPGRIHSADELNLAGAFQDNRVIPPEGIPGSDLSGEQRTILLRLVDRMLELLPDGPRAARLAQVEQHLDASHLCWIGPVDDVSAFYYRFQCPVLLLELDHHAGVFLANPEPMRFHVHTVIRTPNGNDYGAAVASQALGRRLRLNST